VRTAVDEMNPDVRIDRGYFEEGLGIDCDRQRALRDTLVGS